METVLRLLFVLLFAAAGLSHAALLLSVAPGDPLEFSGEPAGQRDTITVAALPFDSTIPSTSTTFAALSVTYTSHCTICVNTTQFASGTLATLTLTDTETNESVSRMATNSLFFVGYNLQGQGYALGVLSAAGTLLFPFATGQTYSVRYDGASHAPALLAPVGTGQSLSTNVLVTVSAAPVPEPSSAVLALPALLFICARWRARGTR